MSTEWKKRSLDEARALGGSLSSVKDSKGNSEDFDEEETLTIKKTNTYLSHLKLVDKQLDATSAPIASMEATPVNNVDTGIAEVTGCSSMFKADNKQQRKNRNQKENHNRRHRPVPFVSMGEVKQLSLEPFPCTDYLPAPHELPFNDLGKLTPASVVTKKLRQSSSLGKKKVRPVSATEENWGPAPPEPGQVAAKPRR